MIQHLAEFKVQRYNFSVSLRQKAAHFSHYSPHIVSFAFFRCDCLVDSIICYIFAGSYLENYKYAKKE